MSKVYPVPIALICLFTIASSSANALPIPNVLPTAAARVASTFNEAHFALAGSTDDFEHTLWLLPPEIVNVDAQRYVPLGDPACEALATLRASGPAAEVLARHEGEIVGQLSFDHDVVTAALGMRGVLAISWLTSRQVQTSFLPRRANLMPVNQGQIHLDAQGRLRGEITVSRAMICARNKVAERGAADAEYVASRWPVETRYSYYEALVSNGQSVSGSLVCEYRAAALQEFLNDPVVADEIFNLAPWSDAFYQALRSARLRCAYDYGLADEAQDPDLSLRELKQAMLQSHISRQLQQLNAGVTATARSARPYESAHDATTVLPLLRNWYDYVNVAQVETAQFVRTTVDIAPEHRAHAVYERFTWPLGRRVERSMTINLRLP